MAQWFEVRKSGNFTELAEQNDITPMLARLLVNRGIESAEAIQEYLHGGKLFDPLLMKDMEIAVSILREKIEARKKIRVIGDYDIDGVSATYILLRGLRRLGAVCDTAIPEREKDGYGINERLIDDAAADGVDTVVTCDNGISAGDVVLRGKKLGLTIIVTDHHDIPYTDDETGRHYHLPEADAVVNPKRADDAYPYKGLCGAVVAWKLIQALYVSFGLPMSEADEFWENAAFATIGDVMDLTGENRTIVQEGLKRLRQTTNPGMKALILQSALAPESIKAYHVGFILGPCINASGRLTTARRSLDLLLSENEGEAAAAATDLIALNESRKDLTRKGVEEAEELIAREHLLSQPVLVVYLPDCHESLAGIIAGRLREKYYRPTFVLTQSETGIKGSGRSIEAYSMYDELTKVSELFSKYGGHPMAAGLTLKAFDAAEFSERINACCTLTEDDLIEKKRFDMVLPLPYVSERLVEELSLLEPLGKGNERPLFAARDVEILSARVFGKNQNVLKLRLSQDGATFDAIRFGDPEEFFAARGERETMSFLYYPEFNDYNGRRTVQLHVVDFK